MWHTLRKTSAHVYLEHGATFTNNLFADNIRVQINGEVVRVSFDLNRNLKSRSKESYSFIDARDLADGEVRELSSLQCDDEKVMATLAKIVKAAKLKPSRWELAIELEGTHIFEVSIESIGDALRFKVAQAKRNK